MLNGEFVKLGLETHEQSEASQSSDVIGLHFENGVISVKRKRLWRIKLAIECLLKRGRCNGHMLESVVCHCAWAMLLRREWLSTLDKCYVFMRQHYTHCARIPQQVIDELRHIRALLPMLRARIKRPWSTLIHMSAASSFGLGVCARHVSASTARTDGR